MSVLVNGVVTLRATSVEFIPVPVARPNGQAVSLAADVEYSMVPDRTDPVTWTAAVLYEGQLGIQYDGDLPPGTYRVFARVNAAPEQPELDCGRVRLES